MWYIRFLTGPLAGKALPLKLGRNQVGRAPHCEVVIPSQSVSKEHTTIEVYNDKIIITDLNSRNGTFVDGIQIKSHRLRTGEKIGFHDIVADVVQKNSSQQKQKASHPARHTGRHAPEAPMYHGNVAYDQMSLPQAGQQPQPHAQGQSQPAAINSFWAHLMKYVDDVILPGVYKLPEWMDFRSVLAIFVAAFIISVTVLSTVPLMRILKSSIEKEAQNRAQTVARTLSRENRAAMMQGQTSLVSTENADREPGVVKAYVISNVNGDIIAPAQLAGTYITDIAFVNEARKINQESVSQIDDSTIVAVAPIRFYNSSTGSESTTAHAVIVYNMGSLAVDDGRTLSLFIQILFIAIITGALLFFFLYRVIVHPIDTLNLQMNSALRDGSTQVSSTYQFLELQNLVTNINSALNRSSGGGFASNNLQQAEVDRTLETQNLVNLIGFPALTINMLDRTVMSANEFFITQIGQSGSWSGLPLDKILDQALKLNLQGLLEKVAADPQQMAVDHLDIASQNFDINAQSIFGSKNVAYVLVVFVPKSGGA